MSEPNNTAAFHELLSPGTFDEKSSSTIADGRMLHVGVLSNPKSGGNRKGLAPVRAVLARYPQVFHWEVANAIDVATALDYFARREVNTVVINGGDGTVQAVLTNIYHQKVFETLPFLAVLRAGTTSMTAGDVGLKGSPVQALRRLMAWSCEGKGEVTLLRRPVLRVQVASYQEPLYGMFFGTACIYQGIQFFHQRLNRHGFRGELAPGLTIAMFILAVALRRSNYLTPVPISVRLNQKPPEQRDWFLLMISTLERLFLGLRPYWGEENGPLHFTAVNARPQHLLRALAALMRGRTNLYGTPENGYFSHNAQQIQLTLNSGFALDGELFEAESFSGPIVVQDGGKASFLRL
jgi:diacylglycerol kinase family enzyme